jgi:hypothetical protein
MMSASFARRAEGQNLLENIEQFGLPDIGDITDLTEIQVIFLHEARRERAERRTPNEDI